MDVSDVKVTDEDCFLSRSMMIKAKNTIMKERTWINRVAQRDVTNVKRSGEWLNMESRNLVPGDLMKLTLGKSTHIKIRDVGGTFSSSFNGVVQCTIDYSGHVLPARTDRDVYVSKPWHTLHPDVTLSDSHSVELLLGPLSSFSKSGHDLVTDFCVVSKRTAHGCVADCAWTPSSIRVLCNRTNTVSDIAGRDIHFLFVIQYWKPVEGSVRS